VAYAVFNSDQKEMWVNVMYRAGNDDIPIITNTVPSTTTQRTWNYVSNVTGIDATRAVAGPYLSADIGKTSRLTAEVRYGFVDHGPHSMEAALRMNMSHDNYRDNGEVKRNDVGAAFRYVYNRTYGVDIVSVVLHVPACDEHDPVAGILEHAAAVVGCGSDDRLELVARRRLPVLAERRDHTVVA
jgi:hypothetical protein